MWLTSERQQFPRFSSRHLALLTSSRMGPAMPVCTQFVPPRCEDEWVRNDVYIYSTFHRLFRAHRRISFGRPRASHLWENFLTRFSTFRHPTRRYADYSTPSPTQLGTHHLMMSRLVTQEDNISAYVTRGLNVDELLKYCASCMHQTPHVDQY